MQGRLRRQALLLTDLALIAVATVFALLLRDNLEFSAARLHTLLPYLAITLLAAALVLPAAGLDRSIWRFSAMSDYLRVLAAVGVIVLSAVALGFLANRLDGVARSLPVIQGLLMAFLLVGVRVAMRLHHARRHDAHPAAPSAPDQQETVLVVGLNAVTELFLRAVAELAPDRMRIAGIVGHSERHSGRLMQQHPVLGVPEDIESILRRLEVHGISVSRIVVTAAFADLSPRARQALLDLERSSDIRVDFFAERIGLDQRSGPCSAPSEARATSEEIRRRMQLGAAESEAIARRPYWRLKRAFDFAAAALLLTLGLPLILLVALVVALDVGLPTTFWQQRPGLRGRPFRLYKFRTMREAHDHRGARIPDEQRVSAIGRFLRRTRLDELPQLRNILVGEMSFVGPRPLLPIDQSPTFAARLLLRPGLTGWAQVSGGRGISPQDKAALDIWYIRNASWWLDIRILGRTIGMIVNGERTDEEALRQAWDELESGRPPRPDAAASPALPAPDPPLGERQHAA